MEDKQIVLVTGMSGAGKTSAMNALEDLGYYCIDSFPVELLDQLSDLIENDEKFSKLAMAVSAQDYVTFMNYFDGEERPVRLVFVDASDDELLLRYRFTRRLHPLIARKEASTLEEAIEMERDYFEHLKKNNRQTIHVDTTKLTNQALASQIRQYFIGSNQKDAFAVTFQSFGFKNGMPMDADEVIDVRFLPNPFYEPALRSKTGNDQNVYDYVMGKEETKEFTAHLKAYMDFVLKAYKEQNKNHLIVAVGCTGGQHRSVSIANWLYSVYKDDYKCFKSHRDIQD